MSRVKILNILLITFIISSCTALNPYIDRRRNPGTGDVSKLYSGTSKPDAPTVCFNSLLSNEDELLALADAECKKHNTETHAVFVETKTFSCKLLLPSTNYYTCEK